MELLGSNARTLQIQKGSEKIQVEKKLVMLKFTSLVEHVHKQNYNSFSKFDNFEKLYWILKRFGCNLLHCAKPAVGST